MQELKTAQSAIFLTLTYNDDSLIYNIEQRKPELWLKDTQDFMKRLRKHNAKFNKNSIRYYTIGEYGENTCRPHYHSIMFNLSIDTTSKIEEIWKKGQIKIGAVTQASIHYTTKHQIATMLQIKGLKEPFSTMSRRPALGSNYLTSAIKKYHKQTNNSQVSFLSGIKIPMPRIYRDMIWKVKIQAPFKQLKFKYLVKANNITRQNIATQSQIEAIQQDRDQMQEALNRNISYTQRINEIQKQKLNRQQKTTKSRKL